MKPETVLSIAAALETRPFDPSGRTPTERAQNALAGITHYVDPNTLRFHHSRVTSARPVLGGAFFLIVETVALDFENTARGTRAVLFDLLGNPVYHPKLEETRRTRDHALRDFDRWLAGFDSMAHYRKAIAEKAAGMERAAIQMRARLDQLAA